ncbi:glycine receptor subunit alpha-2-like isoform X2 [Tachypleus tridentatus]|uniref:glycine receptor subunit alpha-2-like isoform X2 n=1 Tax=Tachypleus tridentatus TaxID=6853 RepID=UPI003FD5CC41
MNEWVVHLMVTWLLLASVSKRSHPASHSQELMQEARPGNVLINNDHIVVSPKSKDSVVKSRMNPLMNCVCPNTKRRHRKMFPKNKSKNSSVAGQLNHSRELSNNSMAVSNNSISYTNKDISPTKRTTLSVSEAHEADVNNPSTDHYVIIIGDELVEFIEGEIIYERCLVKTESYEGLTVADVEDRVGDLIGQGIEVAKIIVHVGSNDIVPELAAASSLVVERLKHLIDTVHRILYPSSVGFAISSILPRPDDFSSFNNKANLINSEVKWYAEHRGLEFIDHFNTFWENGQVNGYLFFFDGTLNEKGMMAFEEKLLGQGICSSENETSRDESVKHSPDKKPSLIELKDILPVDRKTYDKHLPPKKDGVPTTVYFHVTVLSVDSIDEESMTYVADIFLAQSWQDYRLRLPENMTEDYRILNVDWLKFIWRPDTFFKNAKQVTFHEMSVPNHYLWLYYDKTLLYMAKLTLELSCAMKFEAYPHDNQICSMMIESLSHTTDDLVFRWNISTPLVINPEIELPQLDIAENRTEDCTLEYSTGNFTCLAVVFNMKRRLGYHLFHTYIPSALIVAMSWISFWIRPEAIPARVTLGVTSLLTLATQNTQSQSSLPPVSYVKAIDVWMSSCTVFVFMSLLEFAIVNHTMGYTGTNKMMRGFSAEDIDAKVLRCVPNGEYSRRCGSPSPAPRMRRTCCKGIEVAITIDKFSRYFFPLSFVVLNIVYWMTYAYPLK